MPDKTEKKQGKFRKGHSGNPLGRPRGIRNRATIAAEALFEGEIEEICRKAIEEAKRGNIQAIKLVLDRILPPKKEASIFIDLPTMKASSDILEAIHRVTQAVSRGELSPTEGDCLTRIIDWECPISLAEYYALCAVFLEKPTFFVLAPLWRDFFFYEELQTALATTLFESCIIVHLNPLLNKLLPKEGIKSRFPFEAAITYEQQEVLEILAKEDFDRITFRKEKGKIYRCDIEKGFAPDVSEHVLKQGHKNLTITTNIVDGRTASRTRTIKKHLC